ncbi:MAG: YHS domain-containing protein [Pelovirga sp.]
MIKLLLLILLGFVLYSFFLSLLRPAPGVPAKKHQKKQMTGETMVEDPVCGTCLPQADAIKSRIRGNEYYFCSKNCRDRFRDGDNDSPNPE